MRRGSSHWLSDKNSLGESNASWLGEKVVKFSTCTSRKYTIETTGN